MHATQRNARPRLERRAFSLLELAAVVAILGLLAGMATMRFGHAAVSIAEGEGNARQIALALEFARRQAIAEGAPAAVVFERDGGAVASYGVVRGSGAGGTPTGSTFAAPKDVAIAVNGGSDNWVFDRTGALTTPAAGGTINVSPEGGEWDTWRYVVQVYPTTGHVEVRKETL